MANDLKCELINVKGMCCSRCVRALKEELLKLSPSKLSVRIGEAEIEYDPGYVSFAQIQAAIEDAGFETMTLLKEQKIEEVKRYVKDHLSDPDALRLSVLAKAMTVSPFHLSRTFSLAEDETLQDFIMRTRMEKAAKLLRETEHSVLDICIAIGLSSSSHFTSQFKKYFGQTPLVYRKFPEKSKKPHFFRKIWKDFKESLSYIWDELMEHIRPAHGRHFSKGKRRLH